MITKTKKIIFIMLFFILLISIFSLSFAAARWYTYHVNDYWCVDSGKHLDWSGTSTYLSYWNTGVNTWNDYKSGVIREDTALTVNDVTICDAETISSGVAATTATTATNGVGKGTAVITFSKEKMNTLSTVKKNITCTHEIGHALGLAENNDNGTSVIMYNVIDLQTSNNVLHSEDKLNYDYMYSYKY